MYHYLEPYCKVPILAKYKKIACVTVQTPPPPPPQGGSCTQAAQKGVQKVLKKTISSPEMRLW